MYITKHGKKRVHDRIGKKIPANDIATQALQKGLKHSEVSGNLRKYMDRLYFYRGTANNCRIFHEKVFIFQGETLITVIDLPGSLKKVANKLLKNKSLA